MRSLHRLRLRPRLRLSWAGGLAAAWGLLQLACTSYPTPPAQPAFDTDVLPIFEAHCTRCHGSGPDGGSLKTVFVPGTGTGTGVVTATAPCLTQFGNNSSSYDCIAGAAAFATPTLLGQYIQPGFELRMPPPPAPELTSYELDVINAWIAEADPANNVLPICSRSSNPNPALLCTSM